MSPYQQSITEDRRLSLLLVLRETPGYRANAFLLRDAVAQIYGHSASIDQVKNDLAWLNEMGLVVTQAAADVLLATLTARGSDVAAGMADVPGVRKPSP